MSIPLRLLVLEDTPSDAELMLRELRRAGFEPDWKRVETEADFAAALDPALDLILADYNLPQFDALRALHLLAQRDLDIPVILVSGTVGEELAVAAIKQGAVDYVMKDRLQRLGPAVKNALENKRLRAEHKRGEQALAASERRFRALVENAPDAITLIGPDGTVIYDSPAAPQLLGYETDELIGRNVFALVHPADLADVKSLFEQALREQRTPVRGLFRVQHKEGSWRWIEASASNLLAEPSVQAVVINYRDITERKQAEAERQALQEIIEGAASTERLDEFLELMRRSLAKVLPAENLFVVFHDKSSGEFEEVFAVDKYDGPMPPSKLEKSITSYVFRTGEPLLLTQATFDDLRARGEVELVGSESASWLGAPLKTAQATIGVIAVQDYEKQDCYTERDKQFMASVGAQVALAIERKRADEALASSEARLRALFASMRDTVFVIDRQGFYREVAPTNPAVWYIDPQELLGKRFQDVFPAEQTVAFRDAIQQVLDTKQTVQIEYELIFGHQSIWYEASISPMGTDGTLWVARDITERREAAGEIASLARFPSESPNPVLRLSGEGIILHANAASGALLSMWNCAVGSSAPQFWRDLTTRSLLTGKSSYVDTECEGKVYSMFVAPVAGQDYVNIYGSDMTARKQADEALARERSLLRALTDNIPDTIYFKDLDGRFLLINEAQSRRLGLNDPGQAVGKTDFDFFDKDHARLAHENERVLLQGGQPLVAEEEKLTWPDGHVGWVSTTKMLLPDQKGNTIGTFGISRDITERKQAEEALQGRTEEVSSLYRLSRDLAKANSLVEALDIVTRHAVENIHVTFARIALVHGEDLVIRAAYPTRVLGHDLSIGNRMLIKTLPHCAQALEFHEAATLEDGDPQISAGERECLLLDSAPSVCLIPLSVGEAEQDSGASLGLLMLSEARSARREPLTTEKMRRAQSIGDQAATTIRRMLLGEQTQLQLDQMSALRAIDETIASSFDLQLSLEMLLSRGVTLLGVDAAAIALVDTPLGRLDYVAHLGFGMSGVGIKSRGLGGSYAGRVVLDRRAIHVPSLAEGMDPAMLPAFGQAADFVSYYGRPLIEKGRVLGVLELFERTLVERDQEWLEFLSALAGRAAIAINDAQLFEGLQRSNTELSIAYDATIEGWSHALDLRDKETEGHTQRVAELTVKLARNFGLSEADLVQVRWGSLLHDIGKMGVPDGILLKPGPLTDEEWVAMKKHPTFAYEMLSPVRYLRLALDIPYCHHEKWDGSGYPRGLKGNQIPLVARIFAVVDVWDALISDRPYRKAWTPENAVRHIREAAGTHFDPEAVEAFLKEVPDASE